VSQSTFLMSRYATFLNVSPHFTSPRRPLYFGKLAQEKQRKQTPVCHAFIRNYRAE
jgi:hypothetical protein